MRGTSWSIFHSLSLYRSCQSIILPRDDSQPHLFPTTNICTATAATTLWRQLGHGLGANTQVYIDGGARRGTDVIKALCLGAKGVGMGRPFLYSLTYGEEGVVHAIESKSKSPSSFIVYMAGQSR